MVSRPDIFAEPAHQQRQCESLHIQDYCVPDALHRTNSYNNNIHIWAYISRLPSKYILCIRFTHNSIIVAVGRHPKVQPAGTAIARHQFVQMATTPAAVGSIKICIAHTVPLSALPRNPEQMVLEPAKSPG